MVGEETLSEHSKTVAKGSFWSLAGNVFFKLISFVYVILLARAASQNDVGIFYLALSILSIVTVFGDLGISGAFTRYVPYFEGKEERAKIKDLLKLSYGWFTIISVIIALVLFWEADWIGHIYQNTGLPDAIRILSVYALLSNFFRINSAFFQGMGDIRYLQFMQNLQNSLKLTLTAIMFWLYGASILTISAAFVLSFLFVVILSFSEVYRIAGHIPEKGARLGSRELFTEIAPLGLTLAIVQSFSVVVASSDKMIIGYLTVPSDSAAIVAIYSFATTLASVLITFPSAIGTIFFPVVSRLSGKNDLETMRNVLATAQRWSLFITLPVAVVIIVFSADLLRMFYGQAYVGGASVLAIFTFGLLLSLLSYMVSLALAAMRMVRIELYVTVTGGLLNIALNFLLIPVFGMEGAAIASAVSFGLTMLLLSYYGEKLLGFRCLQGASRLFLAALAAFVLVLLLRPVASALSSTLPQVPGEFGAYLSKAIGLGYLGVLICISVFLFLLFALVLKCFHREDVVLMKKAMRRTRMPDSLVLFAERVASYGVAAERK